MATFPSLQPASRIYAPLKGIYLCACGANDRRMYVPPGWPEGLTHTYSGRWEFSPTGNANNITWGSS